MLVKRIWMSSEEIEIKNFIMCFYKYFKLDLKCLGKFYAYSSDVEVYMHKNEKYFVLKICC